MGVKIATTRVACNTATGNQTIQASDLGGLVPKGAIFRLVGGTSDGTLANTLRLSVGATDGTNQAVTASYSGDALETTECKRRGTTDEVVMILDSAGSINGEANFVSFTGGGVTINWGDAPSAAFLLEVTFFAGTDVSCNVNTHTLTYDSTSSITGLGYEPDVIFVNGNGTSLNDSASDSSNAQWGIAVNDGSETQGTISSYSVQNVPATQAVHMISNNRINQSLWTGGESRSWGVSSFDSGGVTFSAKLSGDHDIDNNVWYMTLGFNGKASVSLDWLDTKTSTGTQSYTAMGFKPQVGYTIYCHEDTLNTIRTTVTHSTGGSSFTENSEYSLCVHDEDAQETTDSGSISDDVALHILEYDGTSDIVASLSSMDTTGFTLNYTAFNATAKKFLCLTIEEADDPVLTIEDDGFEIKVATVSAATSTGIQAITIPDWGRTPDAALLIMTTSTGDSAANHAMVSITGIAGIGSAADNWCVGQYSEHNVGTMDTGRWGRGACLRSYTTATSSITSDADFKGFVTGGCIVDWQTAPTTAYEIQAIFFAGVVNSSEAMINAPDVGADITVTTGHRNDIVFIGSPCNVYTGTDAAGQGEMSFGMCSSLGDAVTQMTCKTWWRDAYTDSYSFGVFDDDAVGRADTNVGVFMYAVTLDAFTSTSFDFNVEGDNGDTSDDWFYLSLQLPDNVAAKVVSFQSPTVTGMQEIDVGFKPQAGIFGSSFCSAVGTIYDSGMESEIAGWGAFDSYEDTGCVSVWSDDAQPTSACQSYSGSVVIDLYSTGGSHELVADLESIDEDGFTLDWTTVDSTARWQYGLIIGVHGTAYDEFESYDSGDTLSTVSDCWDYTTNAFAVTANSGDLVVTPNTSAAYTYSEFAAYSPYEDQWAQLTIDDSVNGTFIGPAVRMNGNTCYALMADADSIYLSRFVSGTPTTLDSVTSITISDGDRLKLQVTGTGATVSLTCYWNEALITDIGTNGTYGDTSGSRITSANKLGMVGFSNGATYGDRFIGGDLNLPTTEFKVAVAEFQVPTSTGRFNITTSSLGGIKPKGVIFFTTHCTAIDTITSDSRFSIGAATHFGEQFFHATFTNDNDGDPSCASIAYTKSSIVSQSSALGAKSYEGRFERFISGGCTINFTDAGSSDYCYAVFFGGTEVQARAGVTNGPAISGTKDVNTVGFQPNVVMLTDPRKMNNYDYSNVCRGGMGWTIDKATDEMCVSSIRRTAYIGNTDNSATAYDGTYSMYCQGTGATLVERAYSLTGWDTDGFTLNHDAGIFDGDDMATYFFALDTGTYGVDQLTITTPTSTDSSKAYTGLDFKPQALLVMPFRRTSINITQEADPFSSLWATGFTDGTNEYAFSAPDKHGVTTSISKVRYDRLFCNITDNDGTPGHEASLVSLDSAGFTLNHSVVTGSAEKWIVLAFEAMLEEVGVSNLMLIGVGD